MKRQGRKDDKPPVCKCRKGYGSRIDGLCCQCRTKQISKKERLGRYVLPSGEWIGGRQSNSADDVL